MTDLAISVLWLGVLGAGVGVAIALRALGVASTHIRDLLHVGAGIWVVGWPWWRGDAIPLAIVTAVACAIFAVPQVVDRVPLAARFHRSVTNGDERWGGLVLYTISYAVFTAIGLTTDPFPAAAALLALSLGDGLGGAVGSAAGTHRFRAPGGKHKSLEGSCAVALAATAGVLLAAWMFHAAVPLHLALVLGLVAAVTEAASPRGTDNLLLHAAVYLAAQLLV